MPRRVPDLPGDLIRDTTDLLSTLDQTVTSLREFTDKLRAATEQPQEGQP